MKRKILILLAIFLLPCLLTACSKNYTDYPNVWATEDGSIQIDSLTGHVMLQMDGIDTTKDIGAYGNGRMLSLSFEYKGFTSISDDGFGEIIYEDNAIWDVDAKIRHNKMYLTVTKDYVTNHEGETFVLKQTNTPSTEKTFYHNIWASEDKIVQINTLSGQVALQIDGVDKSQDIYIRAENDDNPLLWTLQYGPASGYFDVISDTNPMGDTVWDVEASIDGDEMTLTVIKDYVSDCEGETFILMQTNEPSSPDAPLYS